MAGQSKSTQRRPKTAKKVVRRGTNSHAEKEVLPSNAGAERHPASDMLPAVSPMPGQPESHHPGTALALAPQTLPIPASRSLNILDAPKGNPGKLGRMLALGGALMAAIAFAIVAIPDERLKETLPPLAQPGNAETSLASPALATPIKQKAHGASNSGPVKKSVISHANVTTKTPNVPATARMDKQGTPVKSKNQTKKVAKTPIKPNPTPLSASASQQDFTPPVTKTPVVQNRYAQCLERPNFLSREQCKWQVCSGKWGQDGCPSYTRDDSEVNS